MDHPALSVLTGFGFADGRDRLDYGVELALLPLIFTKHFP